MKILFAGEQVSGLTFEMKGFNFFGVGSFNKDGGVLVQSLRAAGHLLDWIETCRVPMEFPETLDALRKYQVVMLSDVGADSLLFHPEVLSRSLPHPNRLKLLSQYVREGGGLAMIGGWMSFAGIEGKAKYHGSFMEQALPVTCSPYDDRQERPEGVVPVARQPNHPVLAGIPADWPFFLGYNRVAPKPGADNVLEVDGDPLLTLWDHGKGRAAAFTSDCAPHWGPQAFLDWRGYAPFWNNLARWLAKET